jgi:hypothetical protein
MKTAFEGHLGGIQKAISDMLVARYEVSARRDFSRAMSTHSG